MCDQYNPFEIRYISNSTKMYSYDNELYDIRFPEDWAKTHLPETGPKECSNCAHFGTINGVFCGYCITCAEDYDFSRGPGFWFNYTELSSKNVPSIFQTYLKDVDLRDIGDSDFNTDEYNEQFYDILHNREKMQTLINRNIITAENFDEDDLREIYGIKILR